LKQQRISQNWEQMALAAEQATNYDVVQATLFVVVMWLHVV
jgi:hypothetical protein